MARRRTLWLSISLLGLVLLGTVIVLSSVSYHLAINEATYIDELEVDAPLNSSLWLPHVHASPASAVPNPALRPPKPHPPQPKVERVPRIIHQTWKSETVPDRWKSLAQGCRDINPDYEYILWTDASSREFIAKHYPWFLDTFDGYQYQIQRADAIRYFVLHHYGGIYLDLDVGCLRPLDALLVYPIILPKTIPVGVSNDIMFAEKGHPFMAQTIHNLVTFDHSWYLNYPTVMFSTGPMFLSAQYGLWTASHPAGPDHPGGDVRILPKSLYGKNAKAGEAPHSFFSHFYGSSWHADDAAFIRFLRDWGKVLMVVGSGMVILGVLRLALPSHHGRPRRKSYEVLLPRWSPHHGRLQWDMGWFALSREVSTQPSSPISLASPVPSLDEEDMLSLSSIPLDLTSRPGSPDPSEDTDIIPSSSAVLSHPAVNAVVRLGSRVLAGVFGSRIGVPEHPVTTSTRRRTRSRVFFMPAVLARSDYELPVRRAPRAPSPPPRYSSPAPVCPPEKSRLLAEDAALPGNVSTISSRAVTPSFESPATTYFLSSGSHGTAGSRTPLGGSRPASRAE